MNATRWLPVALALVASAASLPAQDVEMLGRRYGTQPPAGYFRELARDPDAFRFTRGRAARGRAIEAPPALRAAGVAGAPTAGGPAQAMGPRGQPVVGTFRIPVLMGQFSDSPQVPPHDRATVQQTYFDAATGTVTEYYDEVSRGNLTLLGDTRDWVRTTTMSQATVTQNESSLVCCGIGNFIKQLVTLQTGVNWGAYDNDGPDGVANSGDDDGYVDALAVIHPTQGAECGGTGSANRIWSHKWSLSFASSSHTPQATTSPRTGGGVILIDDYFVQGVVSCGGGLNEIGVFAHEAGHAFGLPDLYDTRSSLARHNGAGNWDLMATGTWGCNGNTTWRPCHLGAWSKAALGWVTVTTLPSGTDLGTLTLPPVESSGTVYRVDAGDGSGEYFLLENRRRLGYDQGLFDEGLLVWQIDANALQARWPNNEVNAFDHMAVWLRQADGCDDLGRTGAPPPGCDTPGTRGDAGDPFPGQTLNRSFHAGSNPASLSFAGTGTGLTIQDIAGLGTDIVFEALTRFSRLTVSSSGTTPGATGLLLVDGVALPAPPANVVMSAPYAPLTIEAAGGEVLQPGERNGFVRWSDTSEPRVRTVVTPLTDMSYVAEYGGTEYELAVALTGGVNGVTPGTIQTTPASPDLWFSSGTAVQVSAAPRTGFAFLSWTGAMAGQTTNPASVVMSGPLVGGAAFQMVYAVADVQLSITAAQAQDVQLVAQSGTAPLNWSVRAGSLPAGMGLSTAGRLTGVPLDVGSFPILVRAVDAVGLVDSATVSLEVDEPPLPFAELTSPFLLTGAALDPLEQSFLDFQGNRIGGYDLGDFRAWVLAHPALPLSAALAPAVEAGRTLVVPLMLRAQEGER